MATVDEREVRRTVADAALLADRAEGYRRELFAHCYRMTGSVHDAEDLVQETFLRAWRGSAGFDGRSSLRTWLYRIATNACLTALDQRRRRFLPAGTGAPSNDPDEPPRPAESVAWVEPLPDALLRANETPESIVVERDSVRLALVAALQYLQPRQRAVLLLREVLAWPAAEVAEVMGISVAAVKSLLQRARGRIAELEPEPEDRLQLDDPQAQELLRRYITAFETADVAELGRLLCEDASIEVPPSTTWFQGIQVCLPYLGRHVLEDVGTWRLVGTEVNGQPAAAAYHREPDGRYTAAVVGVFTMTARGISRVVVFPDAGLTAAAGLPAALEPND
ncbi:RNA polymerase, sigma-24 subunit, ECF subfamily [Kribbella flavida DSM 17836]|uniref:RNA polymerase sigma factor n=1 Tax=Kribbella flavida (strain DSM 17836 / JCM 10339 / NBRC 14399) TaxID=479435 RepID=D2Q2S4_KRIFD|nr:sigma-70 family RNA polymerase sigma factor [Kribbella flavida]ADB30255.1 RNA polymerase, sigma-24 subunit, ECF subfamily [Kribbella flavida DSM 17836]